MNFSPGDLKRPELAKHDSSILDLAFVMDCTGSMMSYIISATNVKITIITINVLQI